MYVYMCVCLGPNFLGFTRNKDEKNVIRTLRDRDPESGSRFHESRYKKKKKKGNSVPEPDNRSDLTSPH